MSMLPFPTKLSLFFRVWVELKGWTDDVVDNDDGDGCFIWFWQYLNFNGVFNVNFYFIRNKLKYKTGTLTISKRLD